VPPLGFKELPPLNLGFQDVEAPPSPLPPHEVNPLPPLNLGFDDNVIQERHASLPPLVWGFEGNAAGDVDSPPLSSDVDMESEMLSLPPLDFGFQETVSHEGHGGLPPLNMGFEDDNAASDQSLPPAIRGQHGNLPPLNLGFEEPQEDIAPPSQEAMAPLNLGFREPVLDVLSRAHDAMEKAVEKLAEFDVEGHPAREWVQSQIQACQQMQVLYRQMVVHRKSKLGVHGMLHMLRTVGPDHVRE
jgi:hypothetical protein